MHIWFDLVIFFFLIMVGAYLIELVMEKKIRKQENKKISSGAYFFSFLVFYFLALAWFVIFYGSIVEPRWLTVNEYEVVLSDQADSNLRAAVLSDLHLGPYKQEGWARQVVRRINALAPDIIFLTGDFVFERAEQADMLDPLSELEAPLGVYAVTGNHDYRSDEIEYVVSVLERLGIEVLQNESIEIENFVLAGVDDIWYDGNVSETLQDLDSNDTVVLLVHNPDAVLSEITVQQADLVISGHTHAGQVRLPWLGSVSEMPNLLGRDYDHGLFDYQGTQLFVTSGLGETGARARLFNPPEIAILNVWL